MRLKSLGAVLGLVTLGCGAAYCAHRAREAPAEPHAGRAAQAAPQTGAEPSGQPRATANPKAGLKLGYNLDFPGDWSWSTPFLDLMHNARTLHGEHDPPHAGELSLDAQGYPTALSAGAGVTAILHTQDSPEFVGHTWLLTYAGTGTVDVDGTVEVLEREPGRITFRGAAGNVWVHIAATDPDGKGDYVRDMHVVRKDRTALAQAGQLFNPDLLAFLAPFGSLRFMDWMLSNEQSLSRGGKWAERAKPIQPQWRRQYLDTSHPEKGLTVGGYPVEVMVLLANEVGADPHFNMPYNFEDEYVVEFAKIVRRTLAPQLRVTVEYSNEVWNWGFPQATYARREAEKLWPGEGTGWLQYMGMRASQMCKLWKSVFQGERERVRCVIAPQTAWPDVATASLDCPKWVEAGHEPCHEAVDAIAITGYFNGQLQRDENADIIRGWLEKGKDYAMERAFRQLEHGDVPGVTVDGEPAQGPRSESLDQAIAWFSVFQKLAEERDLELYAYEGGTHFNHSRDAFQAPFLLDMVKDPRMGGLYTKLFNAFAAANGTVFNVWGGIGAGSTWSNADHLRDRTHPKYRAIVDFAEK